jgi:hypothetical protein
LRNDFTLERVFEIAFAFLAGDWEQQEVRHTIFQITFNLLQGRRKAEAYVATQAGDWFIGGQAFNDKKGLNQLRAIELSFRAQIAQVLGRAQAHQTFHHSLISFSHCSDSEPGAVATGS